MNCRYCSTELPEGALFCGECGRAVSSRRPAVERSVPELEREPDPEPEPLSEPEREPDPEPAPEPAAPVLAAEPDLAPLDAAESVERCAQCGTPLAVTDIFCGECGLVRRSVAARRASDTAVLDPFPWGRAQNPRETGAPATSPPPLVIAATQPRADHEDTDETRLVDHTAKGERFVLQFSTGESVRVSGTGLIGRNPIAEPGEYFDHSVTIIDPGKSVSKTHLEFGQDAGAFWVSDRYSGNGTVVREPDRPARRCDPGKRYRVVRGSRIDVGEQFFIVS